MGEKQKKTKKKGDVCHFREFLLDLKGENHQTKSRTLLWKTNWTYHSEFG